MSLARILISGGGTGGHIFPALAIANSIKNQYPDADILFVGAEGKMEMERIPKAGYKIIGLDIRGLQRRLTLSNLKFPIRVLKSVRKAKKILKEFNPQVVVGVGGYASGPTLYAASKMGIPTLIQEQNSYAGITNKLLGKRVDAVCIAYEEALPFFPKQKVVITGNPVRLSLKIEKSTNEAKREMGFNPDQPLILVVGGSLGARVFNEFILKNAAALTEAGMQVLWQTGKFFADQRSEDIQSIEKAFSNIKPLAFIEDMALAYAAADLVISRAGALAVSELQYLAKPSILVPSPFVAENHQYKNASALVKHDAAIMVEEAKVESELLGALTDLVQDQDRLMELKENAGALALPNATTDIVKHIEALANG